MRSNGIHPEAAASAGPGDSDEQALRKVLATWRGSLLDMGGRNRLLNFRHTRRGTLELKAPDATTLLAGLGRGLTFAPVRESEDQAVEPAHNQARAILTQKHSQAALDDSLNQLRRKASQMYNDYGLWVLWLGVAMLDWREGGAEETSKAPLLLVPVELRRGNDGRHRLRAAEGQERAHNPALAVKLGHLGVNWEPVTSADPAEPAKVLAAARECVREQPGWRVEENVVLGLFASHKEAMYQDLAQNEERILRHPLVRAVALGPRARSVGDGIAFEPPDADRIDEVLPPEDTPLVMDADASQRQCIAAALAGRSFVMSGPPGTGKSQTITNMIAALMHAGQRVLFVSEKAAALDVVRNRLRAVGLDDFVLALHSGDTSKKAVAGELARVLRSEVRVTGAAGHELERARRLRAELSAHAAAMNEVRQPLGRTLHEVLGRLVRLEQRETPGLAVPASHQAGRGGLTADGLQRVLDAAAAIGRSWRPAAEGPAFVWRGLVGTAETSVLAEAAEAMSAVRAVARERPFAGSGPRPRTERELRAVVDALRSGLPSWTEKSTGGMAEGASGPLAQLAEELGAREPATPGEALALLHLTDLAGAEFRPLAEWLRPEGLDRARHAADRLRRAIVAETEAAAAAEKVFDARVTEAEELPAIVERFGTQHRGRLARLFSDQYKADREAVTALTRDRVWRKALIGQLDQALAWYRAAAEVRRLADETTPVLGRYAARDASGVAGLEQALATAERVLELSTAVDRPQLLAAHLADGMEASTLPALLATSARAALAEWCDAAERRAERWTGAVTGILNLFGQSRRRELAPALLGSFERAEPVIERLRSDPQGPAEWQAFRRGLAVLAEHRIDPLVTSAVEQGLRGEDFGTAVEYAVLRGWADDVLESDERLSAVRSADLDARVEQYREADRRLIEAASGAVVETCNGRRPRNLLGGASAEIIRQSEMKRPRMPVRTLLWKARDVVGALKPCFMMSPLTVSELLPPGFTFDVVIFDEASQVRPADAINCVYRATSLIVAGDAKQLPPTSFFELAVEADSDGYDEDAPEDSPKDFPSLLNACAAAALREMPLRWHYRSRHEDLITFSNREFYGNSMITFPGALDAGNDVGVGFFHVADGRYDRGGRQHNWREAEYVAQRVLHHFDTRPGRTLGVVALSQAQASAIDLAVQQARLNRPDLDAHFTEDRLGGFFVKNLESVQGDERDVMILSVGYGPDEHGRFRKDFGPLNRDGGWKRLNVAVTRARYRTEVVASFLSGAMGDGGSESVQYLKRYLDYAERGPVALAHDSGPDADATPESPFEESVYHVLREWGYSVQPQVGVAGYRIDLGLRHPDAPGGFALGIECDGAMYHSSKAARDRDRLREEVLTGLGWQLFRIWGTDWYRAREAAEARLRAAVQAAVANASEARTRNVEAEGARSSQEDVVVTSVDQERVPVTTEPDRGWAVDYVVYVPTLSPTAELHTPEARPQLRQLLIGVTETEGPVHEDLLVQRAREAWGLARASSRSRGSVQQALRGLVGSGTIARDGDFYQLSGRDIGVARRPTRAVTRRVGQIAPVERQLVLRELAAEMPGISGSELMTRAGDFFGWKRLGPDIRSALEKDLVALFGLGHLHGGEDSLTAT
ncbi:DUF3320 domain-containing protein [Streptomyces marincola]|uniref:DUF3320 domain-containing protein n=1 Tax=Streptomyces marincola TaxID=2878388 RepID=UPI001CF41986|nr:DUF3320 domain-containing protein [Streptomyces marincola]UCM87228.1 DUF3320 domain-containing protein [Streptomyces marincola]